VKATRVSLLLYRLTFLNQRGIFDQAAEFLFGHLLMRAVFGKRVFHHFKVHAETLQFNNANVGGFGFPDLSLFEFHQCCLGFSEQLSRGLLSGLGALHRAGGVFGAVELPIGEGEIIPCTAEAGLDGDRLFEEADGAFKVLPFGCDES
jgi:hypothetical protein